MNNPTSASRAESLETSPIPWFGPTLYELVPGAAPGTRPLVLKRQVGRAVTTARQDPVRRELIRRADRASRGAVGSVIAEMLTPPLPRHDRKEPS